MMQPIRLAVLLGGIIFTAAAALPAGDPSTPAVVVHQPIETYQTGQPIEFKATAQARLEWLTLCYRFSGSDEFTPRMMTADALGNYGAVLAGEEVVSKELEYYLVFKSADKIACLPEDVPARFYPVKAGQPLPAALQGPAPAPPGKTTFLTAGISGSMSNRMGAKSVNPADPRFQNADNFRMTFQSGPEKLQLLFDARLQYGSPVVPGQKEFNFADGRMMVKLGGHSLQAGSIMLPGTELGLQAWSRRGMAYGWSGSRVSLALFSLSTQQLPGFAGLVVPKAGASMIGGILGLSFLDNAVSLQVTGLTGKDDPSLATNVGGSWFKSRQGDLLSLAGKASLWQNSLAIESELALSRFDPDTADEKGPADGSAWRVAGRYFRGVLELRASLKSIGKDFNSIGQQFLVTDRRILDAGLGLHLGQFVLGASYQTQRNNVADDAEVATGKDVLANLSLGWNFSSSGSLQLGYSQSDQDLPATVLSPIGGEVKKEGYFGNFTWRLGQWSSLQLSAQRDEFRSDSNPDMDGHSLTLNAGGSFQRLERWTLGLRLGGTLARYPATQKDARFYFAFLNGDLTLLAKLLSLSLTVGYNGSEPAVGDRQQSITVDGGLALRTPPAWNWALAMVSLRGSWMQNRMGGVQTDDWRVYLKCDFSLEKR